MDIVYRRCCRRSIVCSRTIEEKGAVYWSRKFQERCERENKKFLDFLKKLEEIPQNFRITALQSKSLRKFFKKDCVNQKNGEVMNSSDIKTFIDFDKVAAYRKSMGYYQIITSELTMDTLEVIDKYHGLAQIEDQFRVMKGDLGIRLFYVRTPEHVDIHAHLCDSPYSFENHPEKNHRFRPHPCR